jgi:predicted membrane protein
MLLVVYVVGFLWGIFSARYKSLSGFLIFVALGWFFFEVWEQGLSKTLKMAEDLTLVHTIMAIGVFAIGDTCGEKAYKYFYNFKIKPKEKKPKKNEEVPLVQGLE